MNAPAPRSRRLVGAPVVLHDGQWWLVGRAGSIPSTDPVFTGALDGFAQAMAAADQAVTDLRARQDKHSAPEARGQR
ncbi:hypothetical protein LO771_23315 [Streptacidiphilus sp. ASG 303]|uniref:hypothetical protein n=1 Tax=Streptacidiphilus sp. ASG 303 TaxID=2896847 RepID=UPI001E558481|nr:hypothetical protein [Streptacidiphilus sp. ASG 303]MCD0485233.1 hypothetical protein [Streptacidiphilus sp. ASG 303]